MVIVTLNLFIWYCRVSCTKLQLSKRTAHTFWPVCFVVQNSLRKICYLVSRRHTHQIHTVNLLPLENCGAPFNERHLAEWDESQAHRNVLGLGFCVCNFWTSFCLFCWRNSHKYSHFPVLIIACLRILSSPFPRPFSRSDVLNTQNCLHTVNPHTHEVRLHCSHTLPLAACVPVSIPTHISLVPQFSVYFPMRK